MSKSTRAAILLWALLLASGASVPVLAEPEPEASLFDAGAAFRLNNLGGDATRATLERVEIDLDATLQDGTPIAEAFRVDSRERTVFWHAALTTSDFAAVRHNDILLLRFWARTISSEQEDGNGTATAFLQRNSRPFNPALMEAVTFGERWTRIDLPFRALQDYPPDHDQVTLGLGGAKQVVEIAGIELLRYPTGTSLLDLPVYRITYPGREADAPWRAEAERRIRELRTAPVTIEVVDALGQPIEGAVVEVSMQEHAFQFGSTIRADMLHRGDADADIYREKFAEHFNMASIANGLKWVRWERMDYRRLTEQTLDWLASEGIPVHGHVLIWPSWAKTRVDVSAERAAAEAGDTEPLRHRLRERIRDAVTSNRGRVVEWDVMNEPWNNNDFMKLMGDEVMVEWFQLARKYDPDAKLFINDFGILTAPTGPDDDHRDHYFNTIQYLLDHGAPLDAIGMQGHFGSGGLTPPDELVQVLDRFATFGKPIVVTEYDLMTQDEALLADYTRDLMTVVFSHPATEGFMMWGFWDGMHWRGNAPMYRKDWSLKPSGQAWLDLVWGAWWTQETMKTNSQGTANLRAFHGDYVISVSHEGQKATLETTILGSNPSNIRIEMN